MPKVPYIIVFDIDGAIVGSVKYIVAEKQINRNIIDMNQDKLKEYYKPDFVGDMKEGLLRPGFVDFINFCKKKYKPCEFYVYTLSSYEWTYNGLVESIEKAAGIKFCKPYFNRENSLMYRGKSIMHVVDHVKQKYKINKNVNLNNKILFIDDIENNTTTFKNRQIKCPKYNNMIYRDVYKNLIDFYGEDLIKTLEIETLFNNYDIPYYSEKSDGIVNKDKKYYDMNVELYKRHDELYAEKFKDDNFFEVLINKLTNLSDKTIKNINMHFKKQEESSNK